MTSKERGAGTVFGCVFGISVYLGERAYNRRNSYNSTDSFVLIFSRL